MEQINGGIEEFAEGITCNAQCAQCARHKERSREQQKKLINRLNRVEGQIRGIRGMVEKGDYCPDILTQVSAANAALNGFTKELLATHIRECVAEDIRNGHNETVDELCELLQRLMR